MCANTSSCSLHPFIKWTEYSVLEISSTAGLFMLNKFPLVCGQNFVTQRVALEVLVDGINEIWRSGICHLFCGITSRDRINGWRFISEGIAYLIQNAENRRKHFTQEIYVNVFLHHNRWRHPTATAEKFIWMKGWKEDLQEGREEQNRMA